MLDTVNYIKNTNICYLRMEVYIETLTGSAFELKVSPLETIMSVKVKIQKLEGIPVSQQHLIWQSKELEDDYSLQDYKIMDGATLKLVVAMRGGPINTRKIPAEDPTWKEIAECMEANRDELWEKLPGGRQVTLIVFRDGDQINFFRVVDRGDGTVVAPVAESLSTLPLQSTCGEEEAAAAEGVERQRIRQNHATMQKMKSVRKQMEALELKKKPENKAGSNRPRDHLKAKPGASPSVSSYHCRLPPIATPRVPFDVRTQSRASSPPQSNDAGQSRGTSVIGVVARRPSLHRERGATADGIPLDGPPVVQVAAATLPSRRLSDIRTISRLHGDGVLRVETSCSNSDNEELESPWHQSSWPASVLDSGDNLTHSDGRSNGGLQNGALAMLSRRPSRNSQQPPHRARSTLDDFEQLQQTLAKFDPRISVQSTPRSRMPTISNNRTAHEGTGFLGKPLRLEDRLSLLGNLETVRPRSSPEASKSVKGGRGDECKARARGRNPEKDLPDKECNNSSIVPKPLRVGCDTINKLQGSTNEQSSPQSALNGEKGVSTRTAVAEVRKEFLMDRLLSEDPSRNRLAGQKAAAKLPSIEASRRVLLPRCQVCKRKMGLTANYSCRCGKQFCTVHRYAEMHDCTYDYKTEGRKILERDNPLVMAPKLPKI